MAKYLNPKNDLTFKRIFGEHPELLLNFLNAIMPFEEGRYIEELHYLSAEQVPDNPGKKNSIVDVKCIDNYKRQFIVEMQMLWDESFFNRVVFNASKAYVKQLNKSEDYDLLQPVYNLALVNENYDKKTNNFYHYYQIVNVANTDETIDGLQFVLVELLKFKPKTWADKKLAVLWLRFLNEVNEDLKELPKELLENEYIGKAAELCERAAFTPEELEKYEAYWDMIRVEKSIRAGALRKGEKIGIKKGEKIGIEKGKAEEKLEIAKKLLNANIPINIIIESTGLTKEELENL